MSAEPLTHVTPEEYLEADRTAEYKSEYYDGIVYAMSGGSYPHALIANNFGGALWQALRGQRCTVTSGDVRVRVTPSTYVYPDVVVIGGEPKFAGDRKDIILNPVLVVEVLSPSTEAHDRGLKFIRYRTAESLQEYVLVSQDAPRVEVYRRQPEDRWLLTTYTGLDANCPLESIDCTIPLSDIYVGINLDNIE